jgi:hypothetical protein
MARVQPDGSWKATFSALGYSGQNLFVQYAPKSSYAHIADRDGDDYWWYSPRRYQVPTTVNMDAEAADTGSSGNLMGLGDIYDHAMVFWNGFYTAGVNPARNHPINILYPNTWYDCETGQPWSCASPDGDIWIIPAHATAFAIQHELGHQLNNEFWGSFEGGGKHSVSTCSAPQVALSEGFADAIPYWLTGTFDNTPPTVNGGPSDIETPDPSLCVGDWNEWHVATTFWDLVDRRLDGSDALAMEPQVLPLLVYLWAGQKVSLRFYLGDHMAFTPLPNTRVMDVYRNNTIIP